MISRQGPWYHTLSYYLRYKPLDLITDPYHWFVQGVENLIKWFPLVWYDRNWDWTWILEVLQFKIEQTRKYHEKYGCSVKEEEERYIRDMKRCEAVLARMVRGDCDTYFTMYDKNKAMGFRHFEKKRWGVASYEDYMFKQDMEYLGRMLKKHLRTWWD